MANKKLAGLPLTDREREVAELLVRGMSNKLIARSLSISDHTAKFHVNNVIAKLGGSTRVDAAVAFTLQMVGVTAERLREAYVVRSSAAA